MPKPKGPMLLLCLLIVLPLACSEASIDSLKGLKDETEGAVDEAKKRAKGWREFSEQEIEKIWSIEYKTVRVARSDPKGLEKTLNELGKERWDCYHVGEEEEEAILYLKRHKSSALRYIPLSDLLRLFSLASGGHD